MAKKISEKDFEALSLVMDRFQRAESFAKAWHDNGDEWYKRYRFYKESGRYPYKHNVKDRLTFTIVEVITSRVLQALFAVSPFLSIVPREGDDVRMCKQLEKVVQTLIANPDREFFLEFEDFVKQCVIYGTSYLSVTPRFNTETWDFDGLNFDCEDFMDVFPDPAAKRLSRAKFIVKRSIRYFDELKELEKLGVYKNVDMAMNDTVADFDHSTKMRLSEIGLLTGVDYADPKTGEIELLDYFEGGHIITVAARKVVIRDTKNEVQRRATADQSGGNYTVDSVLPYNLPLLDLRFIQVPREFFGIGAPEVLSDDQHTIDLLRSSILDNIDMVSNKLFKVRINSDIDPDSIYSAPGNIIPVANMDDIDEFRISELSGSVWQGLEATKSAANDSIGEQPYSRGEPPVRRETATGIVRLQEATMTRFDTVLKNMEFTAIRGIGQKTVQIIHEYMNPQQYARIVNPKDEIEMGAIEQFFSLSKEEIMQQVDITPVGSSITSVKEVRTQQIMQAQQLLMQMAQAGPQSTPPFNVNMLEVSKMALEDLDIKNINELVQEMPPQPPAPPQQPQGQPQGGQGGPPQPLPPTQPPGPGQLAGAPGGGFPF